MRMSLGYKQFGSTGLKPQDVFGITRRNGTNGSASINSGLNFTLNGGMVWAKNRVGAGVAHVLFDTLRGPGAMLFSSNTLAQYLGTTGADTVGLSAFTSTGFNVASDNQYGAINYYSGQNYVNWQFLRAAKFFDAVTYTGNGVGGRQIAHSLGVAPGMIIVKRTSAAASWAVYHRGYAAGYGYLDQTIAFTGDGGQTFGNGFFGGAVAPTSTVFTVGDDSPVNSSGQTYVAYLFAHDPDPSGIVQCGSINSGTAANLGWRPQYVLFRAVGGSDWYIVDQSRGLSDAAATNDALLRANTSGVETNTFDPIATNSAGFTLNSTVFGVQSFVYLAIREPI